MTKLSRKERKKRHAKKVLDCVQTIWTVFQEALEHKMEDESPHDRMNRALRAADACIQSLLKECPQERHIVREAIGKVEAMMELMIVTASESVAKREELAGGKDAD